MPGVLGVSLLRIVVGHLRRNAEGNRVSAGRPRKQKGHMFPRSGSWLGRFYVTQDGERVRQTVTIGRTEDMTEEEARKQLLQIIKLNEKQERIQNVFGGPTFVCHTGRTLKDMHHVGCLSELLVCIDLLGKGWSVYRALDAGAACDLVAIRGDEVVRVEVKTDGPRIKLKKKWGRFDILAVAYADNKIRYFAHNSLPDVNTIRAHRVREILATTPEKVMQNLATNQPEIGLEVNENTRVN
jgi:hypothetical protein